MGDSESPCLAERLRVSVFRSMEVLHSIASLHAATDGAEILGVMGEPVLCEGRKEITSFGGWRAYVAGLKPGS